MFVILLFNRKGARRVFTKDREGIFIPEFSLCALVILLSAPLWLKKRNLSAHQCAIISNIRSKIANIACNIISKIFPHDPKNISPPDPGIL
jgi:hypothetical protein